MHVTERPANGRPVPEDVPALDTPPLDRTHTDWMSQVEAIKQRPFKFSCLGMGCGATLLLLAAILVLIYWIRQQ